MLYHQCLKQYENELLEKMTYRNLREATWGVNIWDDKKRYPSLALFKFELNRDAEFNMGDMLQHYIQAFGQADRKNTVIAKLMKEMSGQDRFPRCQMHHVRDTVLTAARPTRKTLDIVLGLGNSVVKEADMLNAVERLHVGAFYSALMSTGIVILDNKYCQVTGALHRHFPPLSLSSIVSISEYNEESNAEVMLYPKRAVKKKADTSLFEEELD